MNVFVYSRSYQSIYYQEIQYIIGKVLETGGRIFFPKNLEKDLISAFQLPKNTVFLDDHDLLDEETDLVISLGGDGTLLATVNIVKNRNIPILGINFGRMGFLSYTPREDLPLVLENFIEGNYRLSNRTVLEIANARELTGKEYYALNDVCIHKTDTGSMILVKTYINGTYLNAYWSDGIIVSTPTGSTAYNLSCGGAILSPDVHDFIITPISPHNLSVRPIVIPDNYVISFIPEGRTKRFVVSADSMQFFVENDVEIIVKKAPFTIPFLEMPGDNFFNILREKMKWGEDIRNDEKSTEKNFSFI
ncbi:MAG: NAD kinase [Bacteroidales bacterium]|nr:NAD kinase [Bacteroidales bacterium]